MKKTITTKLESNGKEIAQFQISQKAIIYNPKDQKYLLVKYAKQDKSSPDYWGFIGGRIDTGESAEEALQREIMEEAGKIDFRILDIVGVNVEQWCRVGYLVWYEGGEIILSREHSEYVWETAENILSSDIYLDKVKFFIRKAEENLEAEKYLENWQRSVAEFENYKKSKMNVERDMAGRAVEDFAYRLLPVVDNFHSSTDHIPEEQAGSGWVQGIMYIQKQLEQVLGEMGVVEIEAKEGDKFDPALHEAVGEVSDKQQVTSDKEEKEEDREVTGVKDFSPEPEKVKKVLVRGYKRGERVVRPARVIVG